jgi:hypothetical protein
MRIYKIPFEFEHEEKIGGYISLRQLGYLVLIFISLGILFLPLPVMIKTVLFTLTVSFLASCAFIRVLGQYFDRFILTFFSFVFRRKKIQFKR